MNDVAFARFPVNGLNADLNSADSADEEGDQGTAYVVEFLNSSRLPPHKLRFREGMPIMLLRD